MISFPIKPKNARTGNMIGNSEMSMFHFEERKRGKLLTGFPIEPRTMNARAGRG